VTNGPGPVEPEVEELRRLLEQEIERQALPWRGCWPLVIAVAGLLLGVLLLFGLR
jgi:hypothetical protein